MVIYLRPILLIPLVAEIAEPLGAQADDPRDNFAKSYAAYINKNPAQAKELFQKTTDATYPLADYSLYYLGRIAFDETNWDQARKYMTQLRQRYPQSVWFHGAAVLRVKIDIAENKYVLAGETLRHLRADKSVPRELADETLLLQAQVHEAQGDINRAFTIYRDLRDASPTSRWAASARKEQARLRGKSPNLFALNTVDAQADEADRLARERQTSDAEELYKKILASVSDPTDRLRYLTKLAALDDSTCRLAWLYYRNGEFQIAQVMFRALVAQSKNGGFATASIYWQARIAEKLGDMEGAKQLYRQIVSGGEESYYQALSLRSLERLGTPVETAKTAPPVPVSEVDPPLRPELSFHLSRARELASMALYPLAVSEFDEVNRQAKAKEPIRALLMREYFRSQAYSRSLNLANQLPYSQSERDLYRYPLAYWDSVQQKAQERGLDPYLILALIRQESLFNTRARSPATALGLMQLIPPTAARVAKQMGLPAPSQEKLFDPELNVTIGTQYLKDLLDRYSNNWFKAVAAYNAGEAAVDRWEKEITTDDIEEFVERIPYVETRGYVKLVLRNHRIYKRLYEPQK